MLEMWNSVLSIWKVFFAELRSPIYNEFLQTWKVGQKSGERKKKIQKCKDFFIYSS
jgi:hypothetical protein